MEMPLWAVMVSLAIAALGPFGTWVIGQRNFGRLQARVDGHDDELGRQDERIQRVHARIDKTDERIGDVAGVVSGHAASIGRLQGEMTIALSRRPSRT